MFKAIKILSLFALIIQLVGCDSKEPIILGPDTQDQLEIEILAPDAQNIVSVEGYDSSGVVNATPKFANRIFITSVTYSNNDDNIYKKLEYAEAQFFDRSKPIRMNSKFLGFESKYVGTLFFNSDTANVLPNYIFYRGNEQMAHKIAGVKYQLKLSNRFPFESDVRVRIEKKSHTISDFNIPTPKQIIGRATLRGSVAGKNVRLGIVWNGKGSGKIEVIIGGEMNDTGNILPVVQFKTLDNGKIELPENILKAIPFDRFKNLKITLIRKNQYTGNNNLIDKYIVAQSIHNIRITLQ